ncbi:putative peptide/nitrate transporter [Acorus calamus]|uniref:Peptide/nitrate transporter n=1 Tax=Acorus calamus TaxID=4465 RepID=A0AAV9F0X3_ACOCL|nr:putative peptide/nitrate transporter [Acorus calamus]
MAYTEIFSLWAVSEKKFGGLSFTSQDVGVVLAISGFGLLLFQATLYPMIERNIGPIRLSRYAAYLAVLLLSTYTFIAKLRGIALYVIINCASLVKNVLSSQDQRGAANGISMTGMSLFKTVAPASGGALFALAQKRQHASFLPEGNYMFIGAEQGFYFGTG